ncbi:ActD-like protein [Myxococcota bacterium]|nr:ActD-like protein [Myxococcota bacterium]
MKEKISELMIERFVLGELPEAQARKVRAELEATDEGLARLAEIEKSNTEILEQYPVQKVTKEVQRRKAEADFRDLKAAAKPPLFRFALYAAPVFSALLIFVVINMDEGGIVQSPQEVIYLKGDAQLVIHRLRGDMQQKLEPDSAEAMATDRLQIAYRADAAKFGVIFSIDGKGVVTLHLSDGEMAMALKMGELVSLPHSYELDDAPDFERFFFVSGDEPFVVDTIREAARKLVSDLKRAATEPLELPPGLHQVDFKVRKTSPTKQEVSK